MSNRTQKDWRELESMEDAARRLLAELDERVKRKASERLQGSEKIADRPLSPDENAEERSHVGSGRLDAPPQLTLPWGGDGSDHVAKTHKGNAIGITGGQAGLRVAKRFSFRGNKDTACPTLDEPLLADRAKSHAPEDW